MSMELLQRKICEKRTPAMVSLDLTPALLPPSVWQGGSVADLAAAYECWGKSILDALVDTIPAVKLHPVWFERLGSRGFDVVRALCGHAKSLGYYVLLETGRSDHPAAAELSAATYFGPLSDQNEPWEHPWPIDGLFIGGYTGSDGVKPYLAHCKTLNKSIFVQARTADKSAREVQDLISGDRVVHTAMADLAVRWSVGMEDGSGFSRVGVSLCPRTADAAAELRRRYERLFFLIPGRTVHGSSFKEMTRLFNKYGHGAVMEISSGLLDAWERHPTDPTGAIQLAGERLRDELARHVKVM